MVKLYDHVHAEAATPLMDVLTSVPFLRYQLPPTATRIGGRTGTRTDHQRVGWQGRSLTRGRLVWVCAAGAVPRFLSQDRLQSLFASSHSTLCRDFFLR